jgi:hypothetical protein
VIRRRLHAAIVIIAGVGAGALAPTASAAISPSLTLAPSSATAGSTASLGVTISFSPSGGDTVKDLTLALPPGLLADAAIDGGVCLKVTSAPPAACQVGTGSVSATAAGLSRRPSPRSSTSSRHPSRPTWPA